MKQLNTSKQKQSKWYRINLWIHRWVSLVVVIPFAILCITGVILIFHEEIDRALGIHPEVQYSQQTTQYPLSRALSALQKIYPKDHIVSTALDDEHFPGILLVGMAKENEGVNQAHWSYIDIHQAKLIARPEPTDTFTGFLLELHANWFLGPIGELVGALIALLVFLSLISGLVVYAPYVKRFLFGIIRRDKGKRIFQLDLHNLMGSVVLGWALVVTITGFLLGFGTVAIGLWQLTELHHLQQYYYSTIPVTSMLPIDQVYAAAAHVAQGWKPTTVFYPNTEYSTAHHYLVLLQGSDGLNAKMLQIALVEANTGQVVRVMQLPLYLKMILLSQPLHFGDYGGIWLKLLWALCTLLTLFITVNGAWLWWAKRKRIR
ncbi:PepSY domain-containing protein [Acinetobacter sp. S40]|uniref:PepSY-associated TM helix domain-containing protein n=1 Tax=Acinetobacter sp. S40 TaxID=2767434 RepID=UPI00190A2B1B|nr:PepSY-associated TM helix domain-containing protein [Acinetobacter sp. S40]MBJ9986424.1 PepSY domain-containing protein [Acinetobacter sp. S40]